MIDATELERAAMHRCLRHFGEAAGEIGFDKPLGHYTEAEALRVIDAAVPFSLPWQRHVPSSPAAEWAWMVHLSPQQKRSWGLPPVSGNLITFPSPALPPLIALVKHLEDFWCQTENAPKYTAK